MTSVLRSVEQPELTYRTNVAATHALLEAARAAGVGSLVFASTNAVTGPMDEPAITEAAVLRPLTPYGATKAAGEMLMSAYTASYGVRCACLRFTNVYGPGMQAKDSIVARLMRAIRLGTRSRSTATEPGSRLRARQRRVRGDAAGARKRAVGGPVVIGTGTSLSVLEVLDAVRAVTGAELPVKHGPARPGEMPAVIVDPSRAFAAGWTPRLRFEHGLAGVWEEWSGIDLDAVAAASAPSERRGAAVTLARPRTAGRSPSAAVRPRGRAGRARPEERGAAAAFLAAHPAGAGAPLAIVIPAYNEEPTVAERDRRDSVRGRRPRGRGDRRRRRGQGRHRREGCRGRRARLRRPGQPRPGRRAAASATGWPARAARR